MLGLGLIGVAQRLCLRRPEVAALAGGESEEPAPEVSAIGDRHLRKATAKLE
jgi:hypothetical protein